VTSISETAAWFRVSWDTVKQIDERALAARLGPVDAHWDALRVLAIDEFAIQKGHRYATTVVDPTCRRVVWVARGRDQGALTEFFTRLGPERCARIEAVAVDMWAPYAAEVRAHCPNAELVYDLYKKNGLPVDMNVAFAFVLAIITDSGHFRYASAGTFESVGKILAEGGIRYADVTDFLGQVPMDISCRIAILKAASRLTLHRVEDLLIVESRVSSFGSQAATSLINLGADIAFVGSEKGRERRISGRVRRGVDLDMARLLQDVGKKFGGSGGGHAAAAGVVISGDLDKALQECVDMAVAQICNRPAKKGAK
jgi:hypothetical protein